jgi:HEAT repeat protein
MLVKLKEVGEVKSVLKVALDDLTADVRLQAVIAIREFQVKEYEPRMLPLLKDYSEQVAVEAIRAMGAFGTRSAVGPLIRLLTKPDPEAEQPGLLQDAANDALEKITGEKQGYSPDLPDDKKAAAIDAWRIWWLKNKDTWK